MGHIFDLTATVICLRRIYLSAILVELAMVYNFNFEPQQGSDSWMKIIYSIIIIFKAYLYRLKLLKDRLFSARFV